MKKKAEVVVMYNCYMQTIMTQYALKCAAEYLVAPGTSIIYPGYNIKYALKKSFKQQTSSEDLVRRLCNSFVSNNSNYRGVYAKEIDTWGVWGLKLADIDNTFIDSLNRVADFFCENLETCFANGQPFWCMLATMLAHQVTFDHQYSTVIFDLKGVTTMVQDEMIRHNIPIEILDEMLDLLKHRSGNYYYIGKRMLKEITMPLACQPSGYLIFLPQVKRSIVNDDVTYFFVDKNNRNQVSFFDTEKVSWVTFLDSYLKYLPDMPSNNDPCTQMKIVGENKVV